MFKKANVVLLATNQKANYNDIVISPRYKGKIQLFGTFENSYENECKLQHLYITSDEEIKEDDLIYDVNSSNKVRQIENSNQLHHLLSRHPNDRAYKIIASTNPKLATEPYQGHFEGIDCTNYLPQPSPSFITKFIEEYNKGNVITEVMVEYEEATNQVPNGKTINWLKVNPKDNTITIKKLKIIRIEKKLNS